jgi:DNA polymerase III subunit gamma/tau
MSYEPLHHKYRPATFADLVGQEAIAATLTSAIRQQKIAPAYLFCGPRGTGKTSSARILAKSLNCLGNNIPTETPCGVCEACRSIALGAALDTIEIDAASNTGVDNIRDLIERTQFAPVQCRYKLYIIDECLTGDSLVLTDEGLMRIDNPTLRGKKVLSYNESLRKWEYKKVLRWLERGTKPTLIIKTNATEIRCTSNHWIRSDRGWIQAKDLEKGMKILSPVLVDAGHSFLNMEQMDKSVDLFEDTNSRKIDTVKDRTISWLSSTKHKKFNPAVPVVVEKNSGFQISCNKKVKESEVFSLTGKNTPIQKVMESGSKGLKNLLPMPSLWKLQNWGLFMEHYLEMEVLPTLTKTVGSRDWLGLTEKSSKNGWNTKQIIFQNFDLRYDLPQTKDTETSPSVATQLVTPSSKRSSMWSNRLEWKKLSLGNGSSKLRQKEWLGGTWMMVPLTLTAMEVQAFNFIPKDIQEQKISSLPIGLPNLDIGQRQKRIVNQTHLRFTTTWDWMPKPLGDGCLISDSMPLREWNTNLEIVESVRAGDLAEVYDLEVEDNHNFVANGLLVHNCHMLSTAAFNALLKTLEEPPDRVVFVLATTDPQRVLPTIISRCQRFDFRRIPIAAMVSHLQTIARQEAIAIDDEAIALVAQIAQGGLRDAQSLLDQLGLLDDRVTLDRVWDLVGAVPERDLMALLESIADDNPETVLERVRHLMDRGREPPIVLQNLAGFYRDLLIAKTAPDRRDLVAVTPETWDKLCQFAQQWSIELILAGGQHLRGCEGQIKSTTQPRLWLEVALLGLLPSALVPPSASLPAGYTPPPSNFAPASSTPPSRSLPEPPRNEPSPSPEPPPTPAVPPPSDPQNPQTVAPSAQNGTAATIDSEPDTPENGDVSSEAIWEAMLENIPRRATRELLRQQGHLSYFDRSVVKIALSPGLLKVASSKIEEIKQAFFKACQGPIEVRLESNTVSSPTPAPTQASPSLQETRSTPIAPTPQVPVTAPSPGLETYRNGSPPSAVIPPITPPNTPMQRSSPPIWEEDEVEVAAQRLADFFNGEVIVNLDDPELEASAETEEEINQ